MDNVILKLTNLGKEFYLHDPFSLKKKAVLKAVDHVNLEMTAGETLGLVGESGCGKSTLGRMICRLEEPTQGEIYFKQHALHQLTGRALRNLRSGFQPVFQDPYGSLNPRFSVYETLREALIHKHQNSDRQAVLSWLERVGLGEELIFRYPHQLSGGQRQRLGLARALAMEPDLVVADEPVSSLDVSIQAQIINLFLDLQSRLRLTLLFISHDLRIVGHLSDRVAVMYMGRIMENAGVQDIMNNPRHPYTWALLQALPRLQPGRGRQRALLKGDLPVPVNPPPGCRFYTRCAFAQPACQDYENDLLPVHEGQGVACRRWQEIQRPRIWENDHHDDTLNCK